MKDDYGAALLLPISSVACIAQLNMLCILMRYAFIDLHAHEKALDFSDVVWRFNTLDHLRPFRLLVRSDLELSDAPEMATDVVAARAFLELMRQALVEAEAALGASDQLQYEKSRRELWTAFYDLGTLVGRLLEPIARRTELDTNIKRELAAMGDDPPDC